MGTWYVTRGIEHTAISSPPTKPGSKTDCRTLTLSQNELSEIIFQWNGNNVVKFQKNSNNPNMWQNISHTSSNGKCVKFSIISLNNNTAFAKCSSKKNFTLLLDK